MIINHKLCNCSQKGEQWFYSLNLHQRLEWVYDIYQNEFKIEYKELQDLKENVLIEKEQLDLLNNFIELDVRFCIMINTMKDIIKSGLSVVKYFETHKVNNLSLSKFNRETKLFANFLCKKSINFANLFHKSKKPKTVHYVYTPRQRKAIKEYIDKTLEDVKSNIKFTNMATIWLKIRKEGVLDEYGDFSRISIKTLKKIYEEESGHTLVSNKHNLKKHQPRTKVKEVGNTQMDLKVLGLKESSVKKYVYIFDLIDTGSRFVYSEALQTPDTEHVLKALGNGIKYFSDHGITIKSMQTDNAMMFKQTNFIRCTSFHELLDKHAIKHFTIPLGEPECNGVVERYHLKIDKEAHHNLMKCTTVEEVNYVIQKFMHYHNFERYHYFYEFSKGTNKLPYCDRFMKPHEAISIIPCYY